METIVSLRGWENPIYDNKIKVDANYLKVLDVALLPENAKAVHVGVASHNFFYHRLCPVTGQKTSGGRIRYFRNARRNGKSFTQGNAKPGQADNSIYTGSKRRAFPQCGFLPGSPYGRKYRKRQLSYLFVQPERRQQRNGIS